VSRNALFNVAARALVGLVAGLCLAFLFEYLDDSVAASDIEGLLGWSIVGEIPGRGLPPPGAVRPVRSVADPGRPARR
jgi:capsular polysaccharide biosynthesis protein